MKLSQVQFSPFFLYDKGAHDSLVRGLAIQPSQKFDNFFSEEVKLIAVEIISLNSYCKCMHELLITEKS